MHFESLSNWFNWEASDPLQIYPFELKIIAAKFPPTQYPELLEIGRGVIDYLFRGASSPGRMLKYGQVMLYFPERWLSVWEKCELMQRLYDVATNPEHGCAIKFVHIITDEPLILSEVTTEMVRVMEVKGG